MKSADHEPQLCRQIKIVKEMKGNTFFEIVHQENRLRFGCVENHQPSKYIMFKEMNVCTVHTNQIVHGINLQQSKKNAIFFLTFTLVNNL